MSERRGFNGCCSRGGPVKQTREQHAERERKWREAERLTDAAHDAIRAAARAWDDLGADTKREDCYRARRLLPKAYT